MPPEAVFHVCRIWSTGPCAAYRVQPILCEEWLTNGLVAYSVYITPDHDIRQTFRELPEGVQKLVLLWKEPPWDANHRQMWTIYRAGKKVAVSDPERSSSVRRPVSWSDFEELIIQKDTEEKSASAPLARTTSYASTTMLATDLSDSDFTRSLEREVAARRRRQRPGEGARERSPAVPDRTERDVQS